MNKEAQPTRAALGIHRKITQAVIETRLRLLQTMNSDAWRGYMMLTRSMRRQPLSSVDWQWAEQDTVFTIRSFMMFGQFFLIGPPCALLGQRTKRAHRPRGRHMLVVLVLKLPRTLPLLRDPKYWHATGGVSKSHMYANGFIRAI